MSTPNRATDDDLDLEDEPTRDTGRWTERATMDPFAEALLRRFDVHTANEEAAMSKGFDAIGGHLVGMRDDLRALYTKMESRDDRLDRSQRANTAALVLVFVIALLAVVAIAGGTLNVSGFGVQAGTGSSTPTSTAPAPSIVAPSNPFQGVHP